jgi:hypothetical protein
MKVLMFYFENLKKIHDPWKGTNLNGELTITPTSISVSKKKKIMEIIGADIESFEKLPYEKGVEYIKVIMKDGRGYRIHSSKALYSKMNEDFYEIWKVLEPWYNNQKGVSTNVESNFNQENPPDDKELLKKFRKVMSFSQKIKQTQVAEMLNITPSQLSQKLFIWSDSIPFQIIGDEIVVNNLMEFTSQLDAQFEDWGEKEISKEGKRETLWENDNQDLNGSTNQESSPIYVCPNCNEKIIEGMSPCQNCQSEIDWS